MKINKKIVQIGTSLGIIIDKVILDSLKLKKGNIVSVELKGGNKKK